MSYMQAGGAARVIQRKYLERHWCPEGKAVGELGKGWGK